MSVVFQVDIHALENILRVLFISDASRKFLLSYICTFNPLLKSHNGFLQITFWFFCNRRLKAKTSVTSSGIDPRLAILKFAILTTRLHWHVYKRISKA